MKMNRRQFIHSGCFALGALGVNAMMPCLWRRQAFAADPELDKKMIFIFQRGGNDGINTIIPRGDPDYNVQNRPSLYIPEAQALDTGNGFAQLHPQLQPLLEIFNHTSLNGQAGPGNLAVIHRVGYANQSRSHFDSQQYWENGLPGDASTNEGFIYRHIERTIDLADRRNAFVAAALSSSQMVALKGGKPMPNFNRASDFAFAGTLEQRRKFLGTLPAQNWGMDGTAMLGSYGGPADKPEKLYRSLVHETGQLLGATMETLQAAVMAGTYTPENGAVYPNNSFGQKLREAAMLFKRTPVRVLGLNIGGWDTHTGQGQIYGAHGTLLNSLAQGFQALYRDLQSQWGKVVIVTMTEFGRTSIENGSRGTDHAESSVVFAAGGGVKGGVYNCGPATWKAGDLFSKRGRYLARLTDFRSLFGEIFTRHFGDAPAMLDDIMPGYSQAAADIPTDFAPLNFLA